MDETRTAPAGDGNAAPQMLLDDKYRIERVIGEGAFGRVYLATDTRLRRPVAIKELLADRNATDPQVYERYLDRFDREARAGGAITNARVVTVYEMAADRARNAYLVMEYVDGTNLRDLLAQVGTLPVERAVALALDIARGLEAVHEADIVHRDLKPANIMISRRGEAKVGDFGIAQVGTESQRTQMSVGHPGTPMYMSPEQATGTAYVDGRSDLYSLGLILYEMLVGEPYVRRRVSLQQARPDLPPALFGITDRLLQRDPNYRFNSASDVVAELSRLSAAPQATAPQPGSNNPLPYAPNIPGGYAPPPQGGYAPPTLPPPAGYGLQGAQGARGSQGSGAPGIPLDPNLYRGPQNAPPPQPYGNPQPGGYVAPPGGYAPPPQQPPAGYGGQPPPYNSGPAYLGAPPGPAPQPYGQAPPRRGLGAGAVIGIIGGGLLLLIIGIAIATAIVASRDSSSTATPAAASTGSVPTRVASIGTVTTAQATGNAFVGTQGAMNTVASGTSQAISTTTASTARPAGTPPNATAAVVAPTIIAPTSTVASTPAASTPVVSTPRPSATSAAMATVPAAPTATRAGGATAVGGTTAGMGMLLTGPNNRYSFRAPPGFMAQKSDNTSVDFELLSLDPLGIIRTTSQDSSGLSLDLATVAVVAGLKGSNDTFMQNGATQDVMVNGIPAKRINFTLTDEGVKLQGAMFVVVRGRATVAIAIFSQPGDLDKTVQAAKPMLDSFTFP